MHWRPCTKARNWLRARTRSSSLTMKDGWPASSRSPDSCSRPPETSISDLRTADLIHVTAKEKQAHVIELFDKYNLLALPVVDANAKLLGVVTADDIISLLRQS